MLKKFWWKISHIDLNILCAHKLFHKKMILLALCVKKTRFDAKKALHKTYYFIFSTHDTKKIPWNLTYAHKMSRSMCVQNFISEFFDILKCFFGGRSICSHVPNWIFGVLRLSADSPTLHEVRPWDNSALAARTVWHVDVRCGRRDCLLLVVG
jgi:hypothetical protein